MRRVLLFSTLIAVGVAPLAQGGIVSSPVEPSSINGENQEWSGYRSTDSGGILGDISRSNSADYDGFRIEWVITYDSSLEDLAFTYTYWLTTKGGATLGELGTHELGHWVLSIATGATADNFSFDTGPIEVGWMPHAPYDALDEWLYGIKFEYGAAEFEFSSNLRPVWGNFIAKAGRGEVWNAGLLGGNDVNSFIPVPGDATGLGDSAVAQLPEPASIFVWSGIGLAAGALAYRRRKQQTKNRRWSPEAREAIHRVVGR